MTEKVLRTEQKKRRARAKFWEQHGEKFRLALIGGGMVILVSWIAQAALGS